MKDQIIIDLKKYLHSKDTAMVGRLEGEALLKKLEADDLSKLESTFKKIIIKIPEHIVTINKSFFLGFMEIRIQTMGKQSFLNKYTFEASDHIIDKINNIYIDAALLEASPNEILNV